LVRIFQVLDCLIVFEKKRVAHCDPVKCCGVCIYSTLGIMGPSKEDVLLSLPEEFKRVFGGQSRKSGREEM
jgi:hypothetical protein